MLNAYPLHLVEDNMVIWHSSLALLLMPPFLVPLIFSGPQIQDHLYLLQMQHRLPLELIRIQLHRHLLQNKSWPNVLIGKNAVVSITKYRL